MMDIIKHCKNHQIEWAFFDCFDTLIHRTSLEEEITHRWARGLAEKCSLQSSELLLDIRADVLRAFHQKDNYNYNYTDIMEDVYVHLLYMQNPSFIIGRERFLALAMQEEIRLERQFTVVDLEHANLLQSLAESGIKIAIVSDFYIGEQGVRDILADKGILSNVDRIFISCDYRKRKADGVLYETVLKELGVTGNRCIMFGDHPISDVKRAKEYKIHAVFLPYRSDLQSPKQMMEKIYKDNVLSEIPGLHYSYSIYLFFLRLYMRLKETGQRNIFFLAREGEFLKEAFDRFLRMNKENEIQTYYLYVSRKATLMPSLQSIEDENFERIFRQTKSLSVEGFLRVLNFSESDRKRIYDNLNNVDCKMIYQDFSQSEAFRSLCRNCVFVELYEEYRHLTRAAFVSYVDSFKVDVVHKEFTLVDVGWRGTIQDNIYHIYRGKVKVRGFYIGLTGLGDLSSNNTKEGLLFSVAPIKSKDYGFWLNREFYERLMRASHGMTLGYRISGGVGIPILEEENTEKEAYAQAKPVHRELISVLEQMGRIFRPYIGEKTFIEGIILPLHKKSVLNISKKDFCFERKMFALNKESFLEVWENSTILDVLCRSIRRIKHIIKNVFNVEFYNGSFAVYNLPVGFVMLWGRCIYWKQRIRGEL